ncbi:hypothetical protein KM043_009626 [Ampulex compressa]|nr:hypothetical protein KM043_009626 [Ampulex compressa]
MKRFVKTSEKRNSKKSVQEGPCHLCRYNEEQTRIHMACITDNGCNRFPGLLYQPNTISNHLQGAVGDGAALANSHHESNYVKKWGPIVTRVRVTPTTAPHIHHPGALGSFQPRDGDAQPGSECTLVYQRRILGDLPVHGACAPLDVTSGPIFEGKGKATSNFSPALLRYDREELALLSLTRGRRILMKVRVYCDFNPQSANSLGSHCCIFARSKLRNGGSFGQIFSNVLRLARYWTFEIEEVYVGSHKMVLKRGRGAGGKRGEKNRADRGPKERGREREGERDAGWQADGCAVYWFIRRFSHDVQSEHERQAGALLCVGEDHQHCHLACPFLATELSPFLRNEVFTVA